ncbi:MAG: Hpt domain-containing protein [Steroidobacteraceae bacterium]
MAEEASVKAALQALARDFGAGVPMRLLAMERIWDAVRDDLKQGPQAGSTALEAMKNLDSVAELQRMAHSLKGAGRIFGWPATSAAAAELERVCADAGTSSDWSSIARAMAELTHSAHQERSLANGERSETGT